MTLSRMEIQAVTELLEREAQSPSKDDYKPPGNRGFFIACMKPAPGLARIYGWARCGLIMRRNCPTHDVHCC